MTSVKPSKTMQIDSVVDNLKTKNEQTNKTENGLFLTVIEWVQTSFQDTDYLVYLSPF